jgi:hypothetical protein
LARRRTAEDDVRPNPTINIFSDGFWKEEGHERQFPIHKILDDICKLLLLFATVRIDPHHIGSRMAMRGGTGKACRRGVAFLVIQKAKNHTKNNLPIVNWTT